MTSSHVFFIPAVLLVGAIIGYVMGRRLLLAEQAEEQAAMQRKASRRAERGASTHAADAES